MKLKIGEGGQRDRKAENLRQQIEYEEEQVAEARANHAQKNKEQEGKEIRGAKK